LLEDEREAHDLLVLATDASLMGWGTWDLKTGATEWDERGRQIMGFEDEAQAKSSQAWMERIHPEDRPRVERHVQECIAQGKNFRLEYRIVLPNGEMRHILGTGMFRVGPDGTPQRGTGLVQDVTERKKARAERDRLRSLEAASRAEAAERARIGRELHDSVSHLLGVVHQSLELHEAFKHSDPQRATEKMELARVTTREAMKWTRDLSEMLRVPDSESGMRPRLAQLLHQDLPDEIAHHLSVEGDDLAVSPVVREQLFLVMREAIRNVVSHSGADEVRVLFSVGAEEIEGVVEDDGRGFEQDGTSHPPRRRGGLGYMAERAKLHGGTLAGESEPGKGTRVTARFPVS
jgi:PAS domain S-box-containing protein